MTADRSVTVRLKIDNSDFLRGIAEATAAAEAFKRALGGKEFGTRQMDEGASAANREADALDNAADSARKSRQEFKKTTTQVDALRAAQIAEAKASSGAASAADAHERALHDLAHAQREVAAGDLSGDLDAQRHALLDLGKAQAQVTRTSLALGDAQGEQSAASLAAVDSENKLEKALLRTEQAEFRVAQAAKAVQAVHEGDGGETAVTKADLNLRAAQNALQRSEIDLEQSTLRTAAAHKRLGAETAEAAREAERLGPAVERVGKAMADAEDDEQGFSRGLNTSNDRMSFLVQTALALGPALVPIGAVAVPAVFGLAEGLGFAAAASGVALLAFQGVGTALTALNTYQLQPTTAHLAALQLAMEKLGPAAQDFVVFLQKLRPEFQQLQAVAEQGLLPGVQEGISQAMTQIPLLTNVVRALAEAAGQVASNAGSALAGPFWTDFFTFLQTDARQILTDFATGIGKVIEGIAALTMDFAPLSRTFADGFASMATSFSDWAQGLDETKGFQDFVAYLRQAGPLFLSLIGSISDAFVQLVQAASGLGLVSLQGLTIFFNALSAVLDSPIGPPLLAIAAGISAVSRAVALWNIVSGNSVFGFLNELPGVAGKIQVNRLGAIAGGIGLLAGSLTDLDEAGDFSNTLAFGSIGAFFGPWGAAVGALAGATKDAAAADDDLVSAQERLKSVFSTSPTDIQERTKALADLQTQLDDFNVARDVSPKDTLNLWQDFVGPSGTLDKFRTGLDAVTGGFLGYTDSAERAAAASEQIHEAIVSNLQLQQGIVEFNMALKGAPPNTLGTDIDSITAAAQRVIPALQGAGFSVAEIDHILSTHEGWDQAVAATRAYVASQDTVKGKTDTFVQSVAGLNDELLSTADSATALGQALDAILSPQLDLQEATDAYTSSLHTLVDDLAKQNRSLTGNTDAAIENRNAIHDRVVGLEAQLTAEAAAGATSEEFARSLREQRKRLIEAGTAAHLNKKELVDLIDKFGLTGKAIKAAFKGAGIDLARNDIEALVKQYNKLPKDVRVKIANLGVDASKHEIDNLLDSLDLTERERKVVLSVIDHASGPIDTVQAKANQLDRTTASVRVVADISSALASIQSLFTFQSSSITVPVKKKAAGGINRSARVTNSPILWGEAGPESYIPLVGRSDPRWAGAVDILAQSANALGIATAAAGKGPGRSIGARELSRRAARSDDPLNLSDLVDALKEMRREAEDVTEAEKDLKAAREASKNASKQVSKTEKDLEKARSDGNKAEVQRIQDRLKAQKEASRSADKDLTRAEKELSKQRDELASATDRWREAQQKLIDQAIAVQQSILSQGGILEGSTSVTAGGILAKIRKAAKDAAEFNRNIAILRARGLDEDIIQQLLEEAGTPAADAAAKNLAEASKREIARINQAQSHLEHVALRAGQTAVGGGGGGTTVNATFTGPITTTDVTKLPRQIERRVLRAVRRARRR